MQIYQLPALSSVNDADVLAMEHNNVTYKATRAVLLADVYRKSEVYSKTEVYSKAEVDALIVPKAQRVEFGGSAANLYANLTAVLSTMQTDEAKLIRFQIDQTDGIFTRYHIFAGMIIKLYTTGSDVYAGGVFSSQTGRTISIGLDQGTWNAKLVVS